MIRTQIQLRADQAERLQCLSRETDQSVAELVRQSVDRFLDARGVVPAVGLSRLDALQVVGWAASGRSDVAARHDDYLEDGFRPDLCVDEGDG
ncbi:MAG: ribbon-helix-helix protein, CopG family [Gaiellales bacterium]|nr:ribbon-helix-helix protein, CopG family [Gaiellales bacterium]